MITGNNSSIIPKNSMLKKRLILFLSGYCMLYCFGAKSQKVIVKDLDPYLGTWIGSIQNKIPDSSTVHITPIIWRIHNVSYKKNYMTVTEITNFHDKKKIRIVKRFNIYGVMTKDTIKIQGADEAQKNCSSFIRLFIQQSQQENFLNGTSNDQKNGCYTINFSFKNIDRDTSDLNGAAYGRLKEISKTKPKQTQSTETSLSANSLSAPFFDPQTVFRNYTNRDLKPEQMDRIVMNLPVKYDSKHKKFYEKMDVSMQEPTEVEVYLVDLNKDGEPEVIVQRYNRAYLGQAGAVIILHESALHTYTEVLNERGTAMILTTKSMNGFPDILLGGPGFKVPGYIWNLGKYVFRKMYPFTQGNAPKTIPLDKY